MSHLTSYIIVNSKYATPSSKSSSDFTYSIGTVLEAEAIAVKSISIPNVHYNVNIYNNKLRVIVGATPTLITVPEGQYTITELIAVVEPLLTSTVGETVTITQAARTFKLTIQSSTIPFVLDYNKKDYSFTDVLGFKKATTNVISHVAPFIPNLFGTKNYYLFSSVLSQGYNTVLSDGSQIPILIDIPNDTEYGGVENYESNDFETNLKRYSRPHNIQFIDIKVMDSDLNVVDLHGIDIEMVLKVYVKDPRFGSMNK